MGKKIIMKKFNYSGLVGYVWKNDFLYCGSVCYRVKLFVNDYKVEEYKYCHGKTYRDAFMYAVEFYFMFGGGKGE